MRIGIFEAGQRERDTLQQLGAAHELRFSEDTLNKGDAKDYADVEVVSTTPSSMLDAAMLSMLPHLKFIATRSTGFDHIDLEYCKKQNILVSNVPSYGEYTVAEHVFGLLLTISHNITRAVNRTRRGDFSIRGLMGFDLRGKIIGVVGTGHIGRNVIQIAKGFGMEVIAFDKRSREELAKQLGFRYVSMEELLSNADIITLHVPAMKGADHLLSTGQFKMMKQGMILINTARGELIDTKALLQALAEGKVAAAGLDVLPEEPAIKEECELLGSFYEKEHNLEELLADHILLRQRNVYITPHSAFYTREAVQKIVDTTRDNILSFIKGTPQNLVPGT